MIDPQLIPLLRSHANQLRQVNDRQDLLDDARRLDRIADWLGTQETLSVDRRDWPCQRCDAEPGEDCSTSGDFFHHGRGFHAAGMSPSGESRSETCRPAIESGPGPAYRPCCQGCDHKGPVVDSGSLAVELSHDHSFPGWRLLPVVPRKPNLSGGGTSKADKAAMAKWLAIVTPMLPEGWLEQGGPILTHRPGYPAGSRHVPAAVPGGGYDICASVDDDALVLGAIAGLHLRDFLPGCDMKAARKLLQDRPGSWGQAGAKGLHRSDRAPLSWDRFFEIIERGCGQGRRERYEKAYERWSEWAEADRSFADHTDREKAEPHPRWQVETSNELTRCTRAIIQAGVELNLEPDVGSNFALF